MKKNVIFILLLTLGCATEPEPSEIKDIVQRTKINFASVNEKVFEDTSILFDGNFERFTLSDYQQMFHQYRFHKAQELRKDLEHFEKQEIHPYQKTFISCIHFPKENYTICDDPRCYGVEKSARGGKELVEKWLRELPWNKCPRNPNTGIPYEQTY